MTEELDLPVELEVALQKLTTDPAPGADDQDEGTSPAELVEAPTNCTVFVKGVPDGVTKDDMVQIFSKFGPIQGGPSGVNLFMSKSFPGTRMAYIDFENAAGPEAAMVQEVDIAGTKVQVDMKRGGGRGTGRRGGGRRGGGRGRGGRGRGGRGRGREGEGAPPPPEPSDPAPPQPAEA